MHVQSRNFDMVAASFAACIVYFRFLHPEFNDSEHWWLGISPEGIGADRVA